MAVARLFPRRHKTILTLAWLTITVLIWLASFRMVSAPVGGLIGGERFAIALTGPVYGILGWFVGFHSAAVYYTLCAAMTFTCCAAARRAKADFSSHRQLRSSNLSTN